MLIKVLLEFAAEDDEGDEEVFKSEAVFIPHKGINKLNYLTKHGFEAKESLYCLQKLWEDCDEWATLEGNKIWNDYELGRHDWTVVSGYEYNPSPVLPERLNPSPAISSGLTAS